MLIMFLRDFLGTSCGKVEIAVFACIERMPTHDVLMFSLDPK